MWCIPLGIGYTAAVTNSLAYFPVSGSWRDVQQPIPSGVGVTLPQIDDVSAYVDFFPGTQDNADLGGLSIYVPNYETYGDTELSIAPITGRIYNGLLSSITVHDPETVGLVANSTWLGLTGDQALFYHVRYRNVTYGGALQQFSFFAFQAPADTTGVRLTSTTLQRFPYRGP